MHSKVVVEIASGSVGLFHIKFIICDLCIYSVTYYVEYKQFIVHMSMSCY